MEQPYPFSPGAKLDFEWDWNAWLAKEGEDLADFTVTPGPGLEQDGPALESAGVVRATFTAVESSKDYRTFVLCEISTATRIDSRQIEIVIRQR